MCGDGVRTPNEDCDDNDLTDADGCDSTCAIEDGWNCTTVLGSTSVCTEVCGDGLVVGAEACDDGDTSDLSNCLGDCSGNVSGTLTPNSRSAKTT